MTARWLDSEGNPVHGWTCFHCTETFKTIGEARDHFGYDSDEKPACLIKAGQERGLVMALRQAQKERDSAMQMLCNVAKQAKGITPFDLDSFIEMLHEAEAAGFDRGRATPMTEDEKEKDILQILRVIAL
jgi:hypothetical protein